MRYYTLALGLALLAYLAYTDFAGSGEYSYTKLDFENGCAWKPAASEEEAQMGGEAVCAGFEYGGLKYPVHFAEGDLRQFVAYGPVSDPGAFVSGFSQWNSVHTTIEWRHDNGKPYATIHRWFIDNIDTDSGSADPARRGQVLAISTVADPLKPADQRVSCLVGYVDALANKNANIMAREIADTIAPDFKCGFDEPKFFGVRGAYAGTPNAIAD